MGCHLHQQGVPEQTYPGRVHHALGCSRCARRKHDEERVAEGQLLELQLRGLVALPGGQEILQKHTVGRKAQENNSEGSRTLRGRGQSAESSHSFPSMSTWMTAWTLGPTCLKAFVREGRVRAHGLH